MSVYKGEKLVAGGSIDTHFVRKPAWDQAIAISLEDLAAGYKAPADGMIFIDVLPLATDTFVDITINNVKVSEGYHNSAYNWSTSIATPVSAGDIIKSSVALYQQYSFITLVPFEDSTVSESGVEVVTPELIRNLHDPDWSQAVSITADQLVAGYTVPKRGIIVGSIIPNTYNVTGSPIIKINGIVVSYARGSSNEISHGSVQCPVCANDRANLEGISADSCDAHISFVPYKAQ